MSVSTRPRGEVLAALPDFPFTKANPLIVNRCNPLDALAVGER
jgi:oxalate decarboxylase